LAAVLDRRRIKPRDPLRVVARQSTLRYGRAKAESTSTAGTANPTGLPQRCVAAHTGRSRSSRPWLCLNPGLIRKRVEPQVRMLQFGGGGGIRTPGTVSGTAVFKTAAFNHSATPPAGSQCKREVRIGILPGGGLRPPR
jgi:hypothetical protein